MWACNLDKLIKGDHILGVKDVIFDKDSLCSACCRHSRNGGPQTCLPAAHDMAPLTAWYDPSSPANTQDPREGPSLARRAIQDLLRGSLTRLAREERRDQGEEH